jgi:hypothetical protein
MVRRFRIASIYFVVALVGALLSGTYSFIKLRQECGKLPLLPCVAEVIWPSDPPPVAAEPVMVAPLTAPPVAAPLSATPSEGQLKPSGSTRHPQHTSAAEAMLIWTGFLDGEVGRISEPQFAKAMSNFKNSLGSVSGSSELSNAEYENLRERFSATRKSWQFQKMEALEAGQLWLPRKLLTTFEDLKFGRRYQSDDGKFSVHVAQVVSPEWTLEKLKEFHCCKISASRKLEKEIAEYAKADVRGFFLSALDGKERVSVRAFQKDKTIRVLAITYDVDRDKEFRVLRNVIGSNYAPFENP